MEFGLTREQQALRAEIDAWLDEVSPLVGESLGTEIADFDAAQTFTRLLAKKGWLAPSWPRQYGGMEATPMEQAVFAERYAYRRAPTGLTIVPIGLAGPTIIHFGTGEQKRRFLPGITSGETVWCQGFSEPGAGSDLASLQTRAVRDGDSYVVNGQKIWTSFGHLADWCVLLARTDVEAPKHRGISYFLLDMKSPGITIRPLLNLAGAHGFNEVFFDNVRIPSENLLGEENRGWYVATATLDFERSSIGGTAATRRTLDDAIAAARAGAFPGFRQARTRLADLIIACEVGQWLGYRVAWLQGTGAIPNYEASVGKLFATELAQRAANTLLDAAGMGGQLRTSDGRAPLNGALPEEYMHLVSMTIAGGTSEIQRGIIATRGLGLPRG
ncbi:MAG: acyl-CoA dehydrogenase family protein [Dehalococcoidia bacterium]|nr:acyl-CoA dehydrogenase family protein [Dehalococcoidia bacterium]NUQ54931.1 acyl-CoA dehydrogenase family protein [Dehalococcoidia bacterium]